jgi:hypothetical protein
MPRSDPPHRLEATEEPETECADPVAGRRLDLDHGPVLRFAEALGRLLGDHLARAGFPPDDPTAPKAVPPQRRRRRGP